MSKLRVVKLVECGSNIEVVFPQGSIAPYSDSIGGLEKLFLTEGYSVEIYERVDGELILQRTSTPEEEPNRDGFFVVSEVSRDDLISQGYDIEGVDDETMQNIASSMCKAHTEYGDYWESLANACSNYDVEKLSSKEE